MLFAGIAVAAPTAPKNSNTKPLKPRTSFSASPEAQAVLDQAVVAYKNLKGLSMRYESKLLNSKEKQELRGQFDFARDNMLVKSRLTENERLNITDGRYHYDKPHFFGGWDPHVDRSKTKRQEYSLYATLPGTPIQVPGLGSDLLGLLLIGGNPFRQKINPHYSVVQTIGKRLPDKIIDGVKLQGVQIRIRAFNDYSNVNDGGAQAQWTAWFDPSDHLLRRVQYSANDSVYVDRLLDIKVNPDFPADTFKIPVALPQEKAPKDKP